MKVDFFLDKFAEINKEVKDVPVHRPEDLILTSAIKDDTVVLVSLFANKDVVNEILSYLEGLVLKM